MGLIHNSRTQTVALTHMATFEPSLGWSLLTCTVTMGENGAVTDRIRYSGLTSAELVDVIDSTTATAIVLL